MNALTPHINVSPISHNTRYVIFLQLLAFKLFCMLRSQKVYKIKLSFILAYRFQELICIVRIAWYNFLLKSLIIWYLMLLLDFTHIYAYTLYLINSDVFQKHRDQSTKKRKHCELKLCLRLYIFVCIWSCISSF